MTIRVAINGYGRIGRSILRALYESGYRKYIQVVAINDFGDSNTLVHLTRYDSTHGKFMGDVSLVGQAIVVNGDNIVLCANRDPLTLPWKELDIDIVYDCTGVFTSKDKAKDHLIAGAKKVIISAPAGDDIPTIVYGVNHHILRPSDTIISNASCTTNCLAPVVKPLNDNLGIVSGLMTTVHAYTNDQKLLDVYHKDIYRTRSATQSMIPTKTGAAAAIGLVMPELAGKLDGFSMRVPLANVSVVDLTFTATRITNVAEVNSIVRSFAENQLKGILAYNTEPLVSIDFNHNSASAIFDATQTRVIANMVKVLAWYDNEWGFSNRMLDTTLALWQA